MWVLDSRPRDTLNTSAHIAECFEVLSERRKAYSESIFKPLVENETAKVHEHWPGLVDRMSADACRWILDSMATELESLTKGEGEDG